MSDQAAPTSNLPGFTPAQQAEWDAMESAARGVVPPVPTPEPAAAVPPAPAPAPEPPKATPAAPPPEDEVPGALAAQDGKKYVPVSTLVEERKLRDGKIKDAEATVAALKSQVETLTQVVQRGPATPQAKVEPEKPAANPHDANLEPLQHTKWELEQTQKRLADLEGGVKQTAEQRQAQTALEAAQTSYRDAHANFSAKNPGFKEAYGFLVEKLVGIHQDMGYPERTATAMAHQMEWNTVIDAVNRKADPFQTMWAMAKRMGWAPAAPADATKKVEQAAAAADAAITLSNLPGGAPQQASLASLIKMPKEQFAAVFANDPTGEKWEKLAMGR